MLMQDKPESRMLGRELALVSSGVRARYVEGLVGLVTWQEYTRSLR